MKLDPGLCASCAHARAVGEGRFLLCLRSRTDPRFVRYPRLPVLQCEGHERGDARPDDALDDEGAR